MPQSQQQTSAQGDAPQTNAQDMARKENGLAAQADSLDSLLDDIESTLETNAEEYVSRFVQKGGQ